MKKKILYSIIVGILFLAITNPSLRDFKEDDRSGACYKKSNWLMFSIFSEENKHNSKLYLGICKNFFIIDDETEYFQITEWQQ